VPVGLKRSAASDQPDTLTQPRPNTCAPGDPSIHTITTCTRRPDRPVHHRLTLSLQMIRLHIAVVLAFLLIVLHSKHLHIFFAPISVAFKRFNRSRP
jgi:hypothetical protein